MDEKLQKLHFSHELVGKQKNDQIKQGVDLIKGIMTTRHDLQKIVLQEINPDVCVTTCYGSTDNRIQEVLHTLLLMKLGRHHF